MSKPLEGIRILDFSQFMSGPMCTMLMSDFGAEVIKIENPPIGDNTRYGNIIENDVSSHYATRNRGKKSIVLNMKDEKHKALFLELVKTADAVIENYKPGTMKKFGIDYDVLKEINPAIVYASISGYGQDGPYAGHAAFDQTVQAESGMMSITGPEGGEPVKSGGSIADYSGGLMCCIGTLMGIIEAKKTGKGRRIDVSMMDSLIFCLDEPVQLLLKDWKGSEANGQQLCFFCTDRSLQVQRRQILNDHCWYRRSVEDLLRSFKSATVVRKRRLVHHDTESCRLQGDRR